MRTTLDLDEELVKTALEFTKARTKTEVIERALRELVQREAAQRVRALRGTNPRIAEAPRRRFR